MLQFSHLQNGDLQITCGTADHLLNELMKQLAQGMLYVPRSFVPRNVYTPSCRLAVGHHTSVAKVINPSCDTYEISPISRKIIARNAEDFFGGVQASFADGFTYSPGSANLTFGSYSAVMTKADVAEAQETPVTQDVPTFDLSVAIALQSKEEIISYCEQFGIKVDARKTLPKIINWLKGQTLEGK